MTRTSMYKTRQREAIFEYISSLRGTHVTAAQIVKHFEEENVPIGRTTIYRHLEKLTQTGKLRKYITDGVSGACYQNAENVGDCRTHLHLKCEDCGELQHMECEELSGIQQHFLNDHGFRVNASKTVFYGKCGNCARKK